MGYWNEQTILNPDLLRRRRAAASQPRRLVPSVNTVEDVRLVFRRAALMSRGSRVERQNAIKLAWKMYGEPLRSRKKHTGA